MAGQIKLVTRSLRRSAPCPHCICFAHFNRVRLRVSPFAQDDAQEVMRCEHRDVQRVSFLCLHAHSLMRHPERSEPCAANVVELLRVESPKTRASKSARCLRRSGIYEGLPIAFHRKCYILYHGRTLATKRNICLSRTNQTRCEIPASLRSLPSLHSLRSFQSGSTTGFTLRSG